MLSWIDNFLNKITMYRLVLYSLIFLAAVAAVFGFFGILPINPVALGFSIAVLIFVSLAANELCAKLFKAQPNAESVYITALILALVITPVAPQNLAGIGFLGWAAVLAMASKYILAAKKKHIFNPVAIALVVIAFGFGQYASWWIGGNLAMITFVLATGLLIVRKLRRFDLVLSFLIAALVSCIFINTSLNPWDVIQKAVLHTSLLFFASIMITEPMTTPATRNRRIAYGIFVGLIFPPQFHIGSIYSTPELALVVGNIFSYLMSPRAKYALTLKDNREIGNGLRDFSFASDAPMVFKPGQYMEFTLAHKNHDTRGNRRYFTIASSPTESDVRLGVRFPDKSSSFKKRMRELKPGDAMIAGQLSGDFTLPKNPSKKLVFIAGGIGITPFRSMIKYLSDKNERRDVILLYSNRTLGEIAYRDVFAEAAEKIGLKTIYAVTGTGQEKNVAAREAGSDHVRYEFHRIDTEMIRRDIPDYRERTFYISGTHAMTTGMTTTLHKLDVPRRQIVTDFFPGF